LLEKRRNSAPGKAKNRSSPRKADTIAILNCLARAIMIIQDASPGVALHARSLKSKQKRKTMPTYHVEMLEGRTLEQKKRLVEAITRVSVEVLGGRHDSVDVLITDIKPENWATGGKLWSEPRD
jgi:4-oxalocrotonate tautomerase